MYISVRRYRVDPEAVDEIMRRAQEGYLPRAGASPGFCAYYVVEVAKDVVATVSIFQDREQMEAASRTAAEWVKENLAPLFPNPPEVISGEARAFCVA